MAQARIEDIANEAGVSRGTFYFHYPTKDDVLIQLLRESEIAVVTHIDALADDATILQVMQATAQGIAAQWQDDPSLLPDLGVVALRLTATQLRDIPNLHPVQAALEPRFAQAVERGELQGMIPPGLLAQFFLVSLFGASLAWTGNQMMPLPQLLEAVNLFFLRAATLEP
jgi:AcrR family transcriptional regulator